MPVGAVNGARERETEGRGQIRVQMKAGSDQLSRGVGKRWLGSSGAASVQPL